MRLAQVTVPLPTGLSGLKFANPQTLVGDIVSRILIFALAAAGFIFLVQLISAGYSYLTAQGDQGRLETASKSLGHAALGLGIVITVFFLAQILQTVLGIKIL